MNNTYDRIKESFETFCIGTSMHGFRELFSAKNPIWRMIWTILLICTIGLTSYQVIREVKQYLEQTTNTRIELTKMRGMYPPIKICSTHWMYWVDWNRALALNFTKESVLYGMSFLTNIYASHDFDAQRAKKHFKNTMLLNNFTKMHHFYTNVAKRNLSMDSSFDSKKSFRQIEMFYSTNWESSFLCYVTPGDVITEKMSREHESDILEILLIIDNQPTSLVSEFLSFEEFNFYILDWFLANNEISGVYRYKNNGLAKNFSGFMLPLVLYVDGYGEDFIIIQDHYDYYSVTLSVQAYRWIPDSTFQCLPNQRFIYSYWSFCTDCNINSYSDIVAECDNPDSFCRNQIFRIYGENKHNINGLLPEDELKYNHIKSAKDNRSSCLKKCIYPCEVWTTSLTYTGQKISNEAIFQQYFTKLNTIVRIVYPTDLVIMIETEHHTWEDFVANIGGLLGVWTGASLLSFVQLFYLCCFSEIEPKNAIGIGRRYHVTTSVKLATKVSKSTQT